MYRYGEDFCSVEEVGGLLDHFRQKKQEQTFQTDVGNNSAGGQDEKNTENIDNIFDR